MTGAGTQQTIVLGELTLNFSNMATDLLKSSRAYSILLQGHYKWRTKCSRIKNRNRMKVIILV